MCETRDIVQIVAGDSHCLALDVDGNVYSWGNNNEGQLGDGTYTKHPIFEEDILENHDRNTPYKITGFDGKIIQISSGTNISVALREDGTVFDWGARYSLCPEVCVTQPKQVERLSNVIQISSSGLHSLALIDNGDILEWGFPKYALDGDWEPPHIKTAIPNPIVIIADRIDCVLSADGTIWNWNTVNDSEGEAFCEISKKQLDNQEIKVIFRN